MVISTIFSFVGVILSLLGMDCTNFIEPDTKTKNNMSLFAGISYLITGKIFSITD